jgi:predicted nucleotidyltransferase
MNEQIPKDKIIKVIEIFFPDAKIYLFGSRATGQFDERSDVDIAIDVGQPMPLHTRGQINSMIEALNVSQKVDIVDFHRVPQALKDNILKGVAWKK